MLLLLTHARLIGVKVGVSGFEETEQKKSPANLIKCIVQPQTNRCQLPSSNWEETVPITPRPTKLMKGVKNEKVEGKSKGCREGEQREGVSSWPSKPIWEVTAALMLKSTGVSV